jgi:hypothetical protein
MMGFFGTIGRDVEVAAKDMVKVVEWPFKNGAEVIRALEVALKDAPEAKAAVLGLVKQFMVISPDVISAIAADGFNLPRDLQAVADVKEFFAYFVSTFLPEVKSIVGDIESIAPAAPAAAAAPAEAPAAAPAVPGLHNSVPA